MLKRIKLLTVFLLLLNLSAHAQRTPSIAEVSKNAASRLANQLKTFPQEKIYLHLDKPYYAVGDQIWFRAHMVNAALGVPYELSRYIYVELIDSNNVVLSRVKIRPIDGMFYGQLSLSTDLAEGWYSIRSYTNYMRNVDEAFFYRRAVYIGNSLREVKASKKDEYTKRASNASASPFQLSFFPEGGSLIPGNLQAVGILATKPDGSPASVTGKLVDTNNMEITAFNTHAGLGLVHFIPEAGQRYTATCKDDNGNPFTAQLPAVSAEAFSVSLMQNKSAIQATLNTANTHSPTDTLLLLVHQRGVPLLQDFFTATKKDVVFSKKGIPQGLLQVLLLDRTYTILSDRQLFIQDQNKVKVSVTTNKPSYRKREQVSATILLTDTAGNPIKGNFSISVTDDNDVILNENDETIESRLTLQSDVSNWLFEPNYYFNTTNKQAQQDLDILMLTSRWKRYNLASTLKGKSEKGDFFPVERGSFLSGQVISYPSKKGLSGSHVSLFIQNSSHIDAKTTDKNGRFFFESFEFPDSTKIMLQAKMATTSYMRLLVDTDTFPDVRLSVPNLFDIDLKSTMKPFLEKSRERYYQEYGERTIDLKEVEVVAQRQEKDKLQRFRLERNVQYFNPTQTIKPDRLETAHSIIDLLITIPGMSQTADGKGVLLNNKTPTIMIDNLRQDMSEVSNLQPSDVELIDIIKDPSDLAAYGLNGSNGIVFIHLKRGEALMHSKEPETNQAVVQPLGYCVPLRFPEPNYQRPEVRSNGIPDVRSTLFWKPNVVCDVNGKATVNFFLGDGRGSCTMIIEGVTPEGKIIRYQGKINVSNQ